MLTQAIHINFYKLLDFGKIFISNNGLVKAYKNFRPLIGFIYIFGLSFLLKSCADPEKPMPLVSSFYKQTIVINKLDSAAHYYSLTQKKVIASSKLTDWDLKFCSQEGKFNIYINNAKNMRMAKYNGRFSDTINYNDIKHWQIDILENSKTLSAIGNWGDFSFNNPKSYGFTYVIDLGYLTNKNEYGYRKMEVIGFIDNHYIIKYGELNDAEGDTFLLAKNSNFNHVFLSFKPKAQEAIIEPPSSEWDLVFNYYGFGFKVIKGGLCVDTALLLGHMILLNTSGRWISGDTIKAFKDITFWDAEKYVYTNTFDFIGSKWFAYNALTWQYEITKKNIYILKNSQNAIYKMELNKIEISGSAANIGFTVKNL